MGGPGTSSGVHAPQSISGGRPSSRRGASLREWQRAREVPAHLPQACRTRRNNDVQTVLPIVLRLSLSVPRRRFSRCVSTGLQTHQNRGPFRTGFSGVDENPEAHSFRAVQRLRASSLVRTRACRFAGRHASLRADPLADGCEAGWIFRRCEWGWGKRADSPSPSGVTPPGPPGLGGSVLMKFAPRQPISR